MDIVASRAGRVLRKLPRYRDLIKDPAPAPAWVAAVSPREQGEVRLGVYENVPEKADESVLVTTSGLYVGRAAGWDFVAYDDIDEVQTPHIEAPSDKVCFDAVTVRLKDGRQTNIPIRGGDGKSRDAWEFLRFLIRVTADLRRAGEKERRDLVTRR